MRKDLVTRAEEIRVARGCSVPEALSAAESEREMSIPVIAAKWVDALDALMILLRDGNAHGREYAASEFMKMAKLADRAGKRV